MGAKRNAVTTVAIGAALVVLGPVLGLAVSILGVHGAFGRATDLPPSEKAHAVAEGIGSAMNWVFVGAGLGVLGAVVLSVGIFLLLRARKSP